MSHTATISKDFTFSASHQLAGLPEDHPCSRLHGHNYTVRVELTGTTRRPGFVLDYRQLGFVKDRLDNEWDHRHLNDILPMNPTAENMADYLAGQIADVVSYDLGADNVFRVAVAVSETPKTWATVTRLLHVENEL